MGWGWGQQVTPIVMAACNPTPILTFCFASSVPLPLKGKGPSVVETAKLS